LANTLGEKYFLQIKFHHLQLNAIKIKRTGISLTCTYIHTVNGFSRNSHNLGNLRRLLSQAGVCPRESTVPDRHESGYDQ